MTVKNNALDIADCSSGDSTQEFLFSGEAILASGTAAGKVPRSKCKDGDSSAVSCFTNQLIATGAAASAPKATGVTGVNTAESAAVSGAGSTLDQAATDEAQQRDGTAVRAVSNTKIRTPNGQCLSVDPTAGDFRMNLIPVALVDCANPTTWDLITSGKHNDGSGGEAALIVSTATQGCISFDPRRQPWDQVNLFSCGGRADGSGLTNRGQLFPFSGAESFAFTPVFGDNKTCVVPGNGRLEAAPCPEFAPVFTLVP